MPSLHDHFARITVISLPSQEPRRARLRRHFEETGLADPARVTWQPGVAGSVLPQPRWWKAGAGAWGCLLSQTRAIQEAAEADAETVLILEDDVVFHPRTLLWLPDIIEDLPEGWGQLYLGGQHLAPPFPANTDRVSRAWNVNRAHAHVIHRRAMPVIHTHLWHAPDYMQNRAWHLDHQLGLGQRMGKWIACTPAWWLAGQDEGASDICGVSLARRWWHEGRYARSLPFVFAPQPNEEQSRFLYGRPLPEDTASCDAWLHTVAGQALEQGLLPGWNDARLTIETVRRLWPAGVFALTGDNTAALARLADYPANGLFPHPFNTPGALPPDLFTFSPQTPQPKLQPAISA